jgi:hypothetical protein
MVTTSGTSDHSVKLVVRRQSSNVQLTRTAVPKNIMRIIDNLLNFGVDARSGLPVDRVMIAMT